MLFILRLFGGWSILAAAIALTYDITAAYQTGAKLVFASLGKDWEAISPSSLNALQTGIERHVARALWDPLVLGILKTPAFAAFAVFGVLLYILGMRRSRTNIYAN